MEHWIAWGLLGLIAGTLARWLLPGAEKGGWILTLILGLVGAQVGGWVARTSGILPPADPGSWLPGLKSILSATVGAIMVLAIWKWLRR
jgi:uncharacterized membrane protein YeaQ/YmgE (transglycosylase-associated protein family)